MLKTMLAHWVETTIKEDRTLRLDNLPFPSGELVEVIILARSGETARPYLLGGKPVYYSSPMKPVAQDGWEALQ